jgi:hypothetical protein
MDDETKRRRTKNLVVGGAILGAVLTIVISLLMDVIYAEALHGTWRDAIVNDLRNLFHIDLSPDSIVVYALFGIVLLFLSSIGAAIGVVFVFIIGRFLSYLGS